MTTYKLKLGPLDWYRLLRRLDLQVAGSSYELTSLEVVEGQVVAIGLLSTEANLPELGVLL